MGSQSPAGGTRGSEGPWQEWPFQGPQKLRIWVNRLQAAVDVLTHAKLTSDPLPVAAAFGYLQIETHPFPIDQNRAGIDQLLPRAVVALVAAQGGKRKEELHRFRISIRRGLGRDQMK